MSSSYADAVIEVKSILEAKNEQGLVAFTGKYSADERKGIRLEFDDKAADEKGKFIPFMKKCLKNGPFEDIMVHAWNCKKLARVAILEKAMKGTNDYRAIHDVILLCDQRERTALFEEYRTKTGNDLVQTIKSQLGLDSVADYLCHLSLEKDRTPRSSILSDAESLKRNLIDAATPDHGEIVRIIVTSTHEEYKEINHKFEVLTGKTVQEAIEAKYNRAEDIRGLCTAHYYSLAPARAVAYLMYKALHEGDVAMRYDQVARITGLYHELHKFAWVHYACWGVMQTDIASFLTSTDDNKVNVRDACLTLWKFK